MNLFSHHAYLVRGGQRVLPQIFQMLEAEGFNMTANPDFYLEHYQTFGIGESRALKEMDSRSAVNDKKVFVLSFDSITSEAQNSLLKTLEEPLGGSVYFLCVNKEEIILPTLKSRMMILEFPAVLDDTAEAETFLEMSADEKLDFVHKFSDDIKKDRKNKKDAIDFLNSIERVLYENKEQYSPTLLKKVLELKSYAENKGSSVKMIMETLSLLI
jgi:DNA polymerase III delta prime subunit